MVGKRVVSVVLLMVLALAVTPLNGFAAPVNKAIAGDPAAVDAAIEAMNLPDMPDEVAAELRGENLTILQIMYWAWAVYGVPLSINLAAYASRWKPGTVTALGYVLHDLGLCQRCPGR